LSPLKTTGTVQIIEKPSEKSKTLDMIFINEQVITAEIRWILHVALSKSFQRSCEGINSLFISMFSDSNIAKKFQLGRTKCGYVTKFGIAPYFLDLLYKEILLSPVFVISFDESLNRSIQKGQMDIIVRFWNHESNEVFTRYLDSQFLGGANSKQLLKSFNEGVSQLNIQKMIQISSDGPNVNLKFLRLVKEDWELNEYPALLDIGTCGLHTVHGSLKTSVNNSEWKLGEKLKAMWKFLNECPSRREIYENVAENKVYPLPYCGHRWCENQNCCERAANIFPGYLKFIEHLQSLPKSKQPHGKWFNVLKDTIKDPLFIAKLKFVEFIAEKLNLFLKGFQCDKPMVPFIFDVLKNILVSILSMFLLNDVMERSDTIKKIMKLNLTDPMLYKREDTIDIGLSANMEVQKYKRLSTSKGSIISKFYKDVCIFLSSLATHMLEKSPIKYLLVRCSSCLDPIKLADSREVECNKLKFSKLLQQLVASGYLKSKIGDKANEEYFQFIINIVRKHDTEFLSFKKYDDRLDIFLAQHIPVNGYTSLWDVCIILFCLSHGQPAIERGFKVNKDYLVENLGEDSLIVLRIVHDHMLSKQQNAADIPITREMMKSVKSSRMRYDVALESAKKVKELSTVSLKRKAVSAEIDDIVRRKKLLQASADDLIKEADSYALKAEEKKDLSFIITSNDLRKLSKDKFLKLQELDSLEKALCLKRDSIIV
jgi:hypothetical protein